MYSSIRSTTFLLACATSLAATTPARALTATVPTPTPALAAILAGDCVPLTIVQELQSSVVCEGDSTTLSVIASGTGPLTYQWFHGQIMTGYDTSFIEFPHVTALERGLWCVSVTDPCGKVATSCARISVTECRPACEIDTSISSNFNGTAIAAGRTIWFNSVLKANQVPATGGTLHFHDARIQFSANGTAYDLSVPDATVIYHPQASSASTFFNRATGQWQTIVPVGYSGNVFFAGLSFPVAVNLPGGINPVVWSGTITSDVAGIDVQWKWGAAVYTTFDIAYNNLGVKPIDGSSLNPYPNSDHAGTPESFTQFVIGGARGGGGSNYTGSYSGTASGSCP